jgi:hypothetical protein
MQWVGGGAVQCMACQAAELAELASSHARVVRAGDIQGSHSRLGNGHSDHEAHPAADTCQSYDPVKAASLNSVATCVMMRDMIEILCGATKDPSSPLLEWTRQDILRGRIAGSS